MSRSMILAVMCAGCEWGGGPGLTGRQLPDAAPKPDAARAPSADAAVDAQGSGSNTGPCMQPMASGLLATWAFAGQPGNQASTAAASSAPGATAGAVGRSADVVAATGADSMNANGWPMVATLDTTKGYYTLAITPPTGCTVSLTQASITARESGTGPSTLVAATSDDNFTQTTALTASSADATSTPTLSVTDAAASVEVRVFGYGASSADGTFRLDGTLTLTGSFQ
jgi:hypothetical protein